MKVIGKKKQTGKDFHDQFIRRDSSVLNNALYIIKSLQYAKRQDEYRNKNWTNVK